MRGPRPVLEVFATPVREARICRRCGIACVIVNVRPAQRGILVRGARVHNLKNVSLDLPRDTLFLLWKPGKRTWNTR